MPMSKKDLFIYLYPELTCMEGCDPEGIALKERDECIKKRYLDKGFEFAVAKNRYYRHRLGHSLFGGRNPDEFVIKEEPHRILPTEGWKNTNYMKLAQLVDPLRYNHIRVGGYHCHDCVKRFAIEAKKINKDVLVDVDLTEYFAKFLKLKPDFNFENYEPEIELGNIISIIGMYKAKKFYSHPVFGMNKALEQCNTL